jgi:hypothetical protein
MVEWQRRLVGLGVPCVLPWALDVALTLHGQPAAYWAGDYARTTEGGAFYRRLYALHPAAGVGGHALVLGLVGGLLVALPERAAVVLALVAAFGSTWGASTWVERELVTRAAWGAPGPVTSYQATHALLLATAVAAGLGVRWVVRASATLPVGESRPRWALAAALLAALAAIVFGPW